jgi:splicing factor 3B subunit 3
MLAAVEKQKFVYILNRDSNNKLTISSPLEAHKSHNIVFDLVGLDVGFDNPVFACLESDYGEIEDNESTIQSGQIIKTVTFYEMDFGLNHVVRKAAETVPESAHRLIAIPISQDCPGGLIICCADFLVYRGLGEGSIKHIV